MGASRVYNTTDRVDIDYLELIKTYSPHVDMHWQSFQLYQMTRQGLWQYEVDSAQHNQLGMANKSSEVRRVGCKRQAYDLL